MTPSSLAHRIERYWELREFEGVAQAIDLGDEDELADAIQKLRRRPLLTPDT